MKGRLTRRECLALLGATPVLGSDCDVVAGCDQFTFTAARRTKTVYRINGGAPVLFLHELPGLIPEAFQFARRLNRGGQGFAVYLPLLFGPVCGLSKLAMFTGGPCWTSEFDCFSRHSLGSIVDWVAPLCSEINARHGGQGIAVIGNCLTGSLPLALMARDDVRPMLRCAVLSQPAVPIGLAMKPLTLSAKQSVGLTDAELGKAVTSNVPTLALKFDNDPIVPSERMEFLKQKFTGKPFRYMPVPHDSHCSSWGAHPPSHNHAVLTLGYCPDPDSNAFKAYQSVESFLKGHLSAPEAKFNARPQREPGAFR